MTATPRAPLWTAGANLPVTLGEGKATLKWAKATGASRYDVYRTDPWETFMSRTRSR